MHVRNEMQSWWRQAKIYPNIILDTKLRTLLLNIEKDTLTLNTSGSDKLGQKKRQWLCS